MINLRKTFEPTYFYTSICSDDYSCYIIHNSLIYNLDKDIQIEIFSESNKNYNLFTILHYNQFKFYLNLYGELELDYTYFYDFFDKYNTKFSTNFFFTSISLINELSIQRIKISNEIMDLLVLKLFITPELKRLDYNSDFFLNEHFILCYENTKPFVNLTLYSDNCETGLNCYATEIKNNTIYLKNIRNDYVNNSKGYLYNKETKQYKFIN